MIGLRDEAAHPPTSVRHVAIAEADIERLRETVSIVDTVQAYLALRRVGRAWVGLCPFHAEKTGSFNVREETKRYKCFGCGASGDVFRFIQDIEHVDFVGAVEHLAAKAGVSLTYTTAGQGRDRQHRKSLVELVDRAAAWYHERLLSAPDARGARDYLRSRGITGDVARSFRLGWAPDDWDALVRALGVPVERLAEVGLAFINKRGRPQDSFRARVMFPIFSETGDAVAFGGRVLPGSDDPAKYKNSTETPIYAKSRTLYGLNWAKQEITAADEVVVCEGYTDVIGFHRSGVRRAVATCGTALTEDHVRLLKRFTRSVVLAFDADRAGQGAAERFYEWERKFDVSVRVASFPDGRDPGDLAQTDPDGLLAAVRDAQRFLGFRVQEVLRAGSLASPEDRSRTAQRALAVINEHPDVNVRRIYAGEVAAKVGIPASDLVKSAERRSVSAPAVAVPASRQRENAEFVAIAMLIFRWDEIAPWMAEELFDGEEARRAFRALAAAAEERSGSVDSTEDESWRLVGRALELADPDARDLLERAAATDVSSEGSRASHDGRSVTEAEALNLIRAAVRRRLVSRTAIVDPETIRADREVRQLLEQLDDPDMSEAAAGELLSWLRDRDEEAP